MVKPGLLLPRPQTYVFPRVPRLSCTARFTLHIEDSKGPGLPGSPLLCPTLTLEAHTHSLFHPVVQAVLGHLWLPIDIRVI